MPSDNAIGEKPAGILGDGEMAMPTWGIDCADKACDTTGRVPSERMTTETMDDERVPSDSRDEKAKS